MADSAAKPPASLVRRAWIAQMFGDFMDRALPQGKYAEADRILCGDRWFEPS